MKLIKNIIKMANISINGDLVVGKSISIVNGKVYIDGKLSESNEKIINIHIEGNVEKVDVDACENVIVEGSVNSLQTTSGNVKVQNGVKGDLKTTSGDVEIDGEVGGSINTVSGDVKTAKVNGNVKTVSGDIDYRVKN